MNKKHVIYLMCVLFVVVTGIVYFLNNYDSKDEILLEDVMQESAIVETEDDKVYNSDNSSNNEELEDELKEDSNKDKDEYIYIHICGAVKKPGVYKMFVNSRVIDAITQAGGLSKDADNAVVNQAKILNDGEQIYIPYEGEQIIVDNNTTNNLNKIKGINQDTNDKVNINTASKNELITLPGIGEAKADLIINYRNENGSFSKIEDIMNITGIKEGLFNKISEYITV